jgi:hypothetical protein
MTTENWREELQSEIMEHYLFLAELKPHAKDKTAHMIEMREQWEKLNSFISTLLSKERNKVLDECIQVVMQHEEGEDLGYCDTGADMELGCRSECIEMAVNRLSKLKIN